MVSYKALDKMDERELRKAWYKEAIKQMKSGNYTPSASMTRIDNVIDERELDNMVWTDTRRKTCDVDISIFTDEQRAEIISHFVKLSTPRIIFIQGDAQMLYLKIKTNYPDGSGLGRAMWTQLIPFLERYITL